MYRKITESRPSLPEAAKRSKTRMSDNNKAKKIVGIKGMNDILPTDAPLWDLFGNTV